jgi:hypothetical protein
MAIVHVWNPLSVGLISTIGAAVGDFYSVSHIRQKMSINSILKVILYISLTNSLYNREDINMTSRSRPMDTKELSLLNYYYVKLNENTFDEKDIYAFLQLIRNRSKEVRCINELTDFVVQREEYTGFIKDYLFETKKKFESLGKTNAALRIEDVFSFKELKNGINKALEEWQLKGLTNEKMNDFVTCLISILQQITITDDGREIGKLFLAISNKQIILMAEIEVYQNVFKKTNAVFPVLTANNSYLDIKKQDRFDTPYLFADKVIEITNHDGKLKIIIPE